MSGLVDKIKDKLHLNKDESAPEPSPASTAQTASMTSLPKTYKSVVIEKAEAPWTIKDVPLQMPGEGEVLIKSVACGVCASDVGVQMGHFGPMVQYPITPGHEVIGDVVAVGSGVTRWKTGDRVGGPWHGGHDGTCKQCNRGLFQICSNEAINGVTRDGGFAEFVRLRSEAVVSIPKDLDPAQTAPLLCAGVTTFNSIRKMDITPGDVVAVQGLGGLGHLAIQYSRKMGYRTVALSSSDKKKDFAKELGANDYIDTSKESAAEGLQKLGGAALIIVTAPNPKIMGPLIEGCAARGKVLVLAPVGEIPINTVPMIMKGISVHGWPSGHALDSEEAIAFASNQSVKCMIEKFPLDKVEDAVAKLNSGDIRFRAVLTF